MKKPHKQYYFINIWFQKTCNLKLKTKARCANLVTQVTANKQSPFNPSVHDSNPTNPLNNRDQFIIDSVTLFLHYKNKSIQNKQLNQLSICCYEDLLSYAFIYSFLTIYFDKRSEIFLQELYSQYQMFLCHYAGIKPVGKNTFLKIIKTINNAQFKLKRTAQGLVIHFFNYEFN